MRYDETEKGTFEDGYYASAVIINDLNAEILRLRNIIKIQSDLHSEHVKELNKKWDKEREILTAEISNLREKKK